MSEVLVRSKKTRPLRAGHPWIFSGALAEETAAPDDLVRVRDDAGGDIGWGLYSKHSNIRVRLLTVPEDFDGVLDAAFLQGAIERAAARREILGLPSPETDAYRLLNSEGDGLPGLIVDVLGELVVFQVTTSPWASRRDLVVEALRGALGADRPILEVPAPVKIQGIERFTSSLTWHSEAQPERVELREHDLFFGVDTGTLQKTGHYLDMRPHRRWVGQRSSGRRVLDAYSYSGGFGLHAARGGAAQVISVDSSAPAIARVQENAARNHLAIEGVTSKVDNYLRSAFDRGVRFDIVVLDPPKLAPNRHTVDRARKVYEAISVQAMRLIEPGGLFCLTSCSEAFDAEQLHRVLGSCQARLGRAVTVVYQGVQGPDHPYPAAMREGQYATFVAATVS